MRSSPLLTEVLCKGRLLIVDGIQSYYEFGRAVQRAGGDVVLISKDNTPVTRADLELFFEDPEADRRTWRSYESVERKAMAVWSGVIFSPVPISTTICAVMGRGGAGVSCAARTQDSWTSLHPQHCSAERPLQVMRAHWAVENRLHRRRDVTLGENGCGPNACGPQFPRAFFDA